MDEIIWEAKDSDGVSSDLVEIDKTHWQLSMLEGPFSGYPTINLNRKQMKDLFHAIGDAIREF